MFFTSTSQGRRPGCAGPLHCRPCAGESGELGGMRRRVAMLVTRRAAVLHRVQRLPLFQAVRLARPPGLKRSTSAAMRSALDHRAAVLDQHGYARWRCTRRRRMP